MSSCEYEKNSVEKISFHAIIQSFKLECEAQGLGDDGRILFCVHILATQVALTSLTETVVFPSMVH